MESKLVELDQDSQQFNTKLIESKLLSLANHEEEYNQSNDSNNGNNTTNNANNYGSLIKLLLSEFTNMLNKQEEMTTLFQRIKESDITERVEELSVKYQAMVDEYDQVHEKMYSELSSGEGEDDDEEEDEDVEPV